MRTASAVRARGPWVGLLSLLLVAHAAAAAGMVGPSWGKPSQPAMKPPPPPRMAAGYQHSLYVALDGTLWAWGDNTSGQLGDATLSSHTTPAQVLGLEHVVTVSAGARHSLAVLEDGTVWAWGDNRYGQLGDGTLGRRPYPVQVQGLTQVIAVSAGYDHSLALRADGTLGRG